MQHNESRLFFPKFIFIILAYLTHWDVRYEMLFTFLLACIISLNIYSLSKLTVSGGIVKKLLIASIANLLIFAPIQGENWLWGMQMIIFFPIACITTCILVAYSKLVTTIKFLISMVLSTISTFSFANGVLCWIVVFPVLALKSRKELNKSRWLVISWIANFILNEVVYFHNYKKPSQHPRFSEVLVHPQQAIHYFLSFLGAPLSFGKGINALITAPIIGLILIILFSASCVYLLRFSRDFTLLHRMAAWLTIGFYTIISAIITTCGRLGFGVQQSLDSRYTTFSVYLTVSVIYLTVIVADDLKKKYFFSTNKQLLTRSTFFLGAILLVLHLSTSIYAVEKMADLRSSRLQIKSCLLFINFVQQEECLRTRVYPDVVTLKSTVDALDNLGFLKPGLVRSSRIQDIKGANDLNSEAYGSFDTLIKVNDNVDFASGWAILPERGEPADSVVLTYENVESNSTIDNVESNSIIFTVVDTRDVSKDFAKASINELYHNSSWQKAFSSSLLSKGLIKVEAWAFDSNIGKAFKLNGSHKITNSPDSFIIPNVKEINFKAAPNYATGFFDTINNTPSGQKVEVQKATSFTATGWAIVVDEGRPADSIIITYGDNNSLVAVAPVSLERADVAKALNNSAYNNSGWDTKISTHVLPIGKVILKGWAYSSVSKEATQLNNSIEVVVLD